MDLYFHLPLAAMPILFFALLGFMLPKTSRQWDDLPCPSCGAFNTITFDTLQQVEARCKGCGRYVVFVRGAWSYEHFLEKIKEHRTFDPTVPGGQ
jgi:hypothetical protein